MKRSTTRTNMCNTEIKTMSNNVIAMAIKTARNELREAHYNLSVAEAEYQDTLLLPVTSKVREEKYNTIQECKAKLTLAITKLNGIKTSTEDTDLLIGRNKVETRSFALSTATLDDLMEDLGSFEKEDKEVIKQRNFIFGLMNLINMNEGFNNLREMDQLCDTVENSFELRARNALMLFVNKARTSKFESIYHNVFGGAIGNTSIAPKETLDFCSTELSKLNISLSTLRSDIECKYHTYSKEEFGHVKKDMIFISRTHITINTGNQVATISWKDFAKKSKLLKQVVFVMKDSTGNLSIAKKSLTAWERLASLHLSGVELSGLKENPKAFAAVMVTKAKAGLGDAKVVNIPFTGDISALNLDQDTIDVSALLKSRGTYGPIMNADQYGRHGYITHLKNYFSGGNAFIDDNGVSYEDPAKLLVRLQKQANNKGKYSITADVKVVAGVRFKDIPATIKVDRQAQEEFNNDLARSFVGGQSIGSKDFTTEVGTVRVVTGSQVGESGQKTVIGMYEYLNTASVESVFNALGHNGFFIVSGLNSVKSKVFKKGADRWELNTTTFNGKSVCFWTKVSEAEKVIITDSYTAEMWEINPDGIEVLQGVEGALDTLARSVKGSTSQTVTELLYSEEALAMGDIVTRIKAFKEAGIIRKKAIGNKTNSQFNAGLEFQHGSNTAKMVLETLIAQNKAYSYRQSVHNGMSLLKGRVDNNDIFTVDVKNLLTSICNTLSIKGKLDINESQVWDIDAINVLIKTLASGQKPFVKFYFGTEVDVIVPVTTRLLSGVEKVGRANDIRVTGMLAEIMAAFGRVIKNTLNSNNATVDEDGFVTLNVELNENTSAIIANKISTARDKDFGKALSQIPTVGTNVALITSGKLHGNELVSFRVQEAKKVAQRTFKEHVVGLYSKPPILWMGSLSSTLTLVQEWDEDLAILMGNSSYISPEKAVSNGNDADGDRNSIDFIPASVVATCSTLNPNVFIDARDPKVAAGAHFYANFWEEELEGITRNAEDTIGEVKVTKDTFVSLMEESVYKATTAKANVAIYTTHQTNTMNNRGTFCKGVEVALKGIIRNPAYVVLHAWANEVLNSKFALHIVSEAIWKFTVDVQGACVNFDAMDQVKDSSGRDVKKLAEMLSPSALVYCHRDFVANENNMTEQMLANEQARQLNLRGQALTDSMFDKDNHNIAIDQLLTVLPVADLNVLKKVIGYIIATANMTVGYNMYTTIDARQMAMKPIKGKSSNIEQLLEEIASKELTNNKGTAFNKSVVEIDCVAGTIVDLACKYVSTVLVS